MFKPKTSALLSRIIADKEIKKSVDQDFLMRLSANFHHIFSLASQLYGNQHDMEAVMMLMVKKMATSYQDRPRELRKLDEKRMADEAWFCSENWLGMMLYTDRFSGDIQGLRDRIEYFEELGVNLVHLMPLLKCPKENNDGGYAVSDFRSVQPELGTMEQMAELAEEFRKRDMLLMLDITINHTSNEHDWAQQALNGDKTYQSYYYMYDDRSIPDEFEKNMPEVFPDTAPGNFTYQKEIDKWVMTVFHNYQWDLNFTNPMVFAEMLESLCYLINQGVDIMRLDALAFTWKRIGTSCQNLPEAHTLIQLFKACTLVVAPGTLFLAEAIVAPNEIVKYFGNSHEGSDECDMAYNATLMTLLWEAITTKSNRLFYTTFDNIPSKPFGTTWLNYVRCHDDIGLGYEDEHASWAGYDAWGHRKFITDFLIGQMDWSFAKGEPFMIEKATGNARISGSLASLAGLEKAMEADDDYQIDMAVKRILMLHAIILSYGGIPMLYMGDEIGMTNDYSYLKNPQHANDNRWMHRPKFDPQKDALKYNEGTVENRIFKGLTDLINKRKVTREFSDRNDNYRVHTRNERVLAYVRHDGAYRTLCIYNLNDHPEPFYADVLMEHGFAPKEQLYDRITEKYLESNHYNLMLQPYQSCWLSLKPH
jgi:amylosucrase